MIKPPYFKTFHTNLKNGKCTVSLVNQVQVCYRFKSLEEIHRKQHTGTVFGYQQTNICRRRRGSEPTVYRRYGDYISFMLTALLLSLFIVKHCMPFIFIFDSLYTQEFPLPSCTAPYILREMSGWHMARFSPNRNSHIQ